MATVEIDEWRPCVPSIPLTPLVNGLPSTVPFVGPESLIPQGLTAGAAGAVSALASTFPELIAAAVRDPETADLGPVRTALERFPLQAAAKLVVARRGVPGEPHVRRPLRMLTDAERTELETWLESSSLVPAL